MLVTVGFANAVLPPCVVTGRYVAVPVCQLCRYSRQLPKSPLTYCTSCRAYRVLSNTAVSRSPRLPLTTRPWAAAGRGEQVLRAGVGGGGPGGEVGQPAAGLPVQVAIALVMEPDVDDRVVDVGRQRHRVDVRAPLLPPRQGSGNRPLTVERAGQQRRQLRVVPEPEQADGPGLIVVLGRGQETTGRQRADRGLGRLPVQGAPEHPVQQV